MENMSAVCPHLTTIRSENGYILACTGEIEPVIPGMLCGAEGYMKSKTILLVLLMCLAGAAVCFAADVQIGTWKLNEAKSKLSPGQPKNNTVVYQADGDNMKVTVDGADSDGKPTHNEWTAKFDGKDYPVTGDPSSDARSYRKLNDRTLALTIKKGGKITSSGRIAVAADGKSRTVTTSGTDSKGKKFSSTAVYDKQ